MKALPQISEAEFQVMKIVWEHAPVSTNQVTEYLVRTTKWSPKTIQTMLKRLVQKKALTYDKEDVYKRQPDTFPSVPESRPRAASAVYPASPVSLPQYPLPTAACKKG